MSFSQSQMILNFVHQNNASSLAPPEAPVQAKPPSTPRSWDMGTTIERPVLRTAITSQFPFTKCNSPLLVDTLKSVRTGISHALVDYRKDLPGQYQRHLDRLEYLARQQPETVEYDEELELVKVDKTDYSEESAPSSILAPCLSQSDEGLGVVKQKFVELIQTRFAGCKDDVNFDLTVNFTVNSYIQDLETSDTFSICQEILAQERDGLLYEDLDELFISQYNEVKLFSYIDYTHSCFNDANGLEREVDNPKLFNKFSEIWKFNPTSYRDFDNDYYEFLLRDIRYVEFDVVENYNKLGLLMNLDKFLFYFDKLQAKERHKRGFYVTSKAKKKEKEANNNNLLSVNLRAALKDLIRETRNNHSRSSSSSSPSPSLKQKLLRFTSEEKEIVFSQFEPPIYVNLDMNE